MLKTEPRKISHPSYKLALIFARVFACSYSLRKPFFFLAPGNLEGMLKRYPKIGDGPRKNYIEPPKGSIEPPKGSIDPIWPPQGFYRTPAVAPATGQIALHKTFPVIDYGSSSKDRKNLERERHRPCHSLTLLPSSSILSGAPHRTMTTLERREHLNIPRTWRQTW